MKIIEKRIRACIYTRRLITEGRCQLYKPFNHNLYGGCFYVSSIDQCTPYANYTYEEYEYPISNVFKCDCDGTSKPGWQTFSYKIGWQRGFMDILGILDDFDVHVVRNGRYDWWSFFEFMFEDKVIDTIPPHNRELDRIPPERTFRPHDNRKN